MKRNYFRKQEPIYHKPKADKNRYWKTIFCLGEQVFIGISYSLVKKGDKVNADDWQDNNSKWKTPHHKIDMSKLIEGETVYCPKCGSKVDFRMWLSATKPDFVVKAKYGDDQKDYLN